MYKIIFFFLKSYITPLIAIIPLSLGYAIFESLNAATLLPMAKSVMTESIGSIDAYGRIIHAIYRMIYLFPIKDTFIAACVLLIVVAILKTSCFLLFTIYSNKLSQASRRNLQDEVYKKMIHSDYHYFLDHQQGDLIYRLLNAPPSVGALLKSIPDIFIHCSKITFLIILLFTISFKATLSLLIIGTTFGVLVKLISGRSYRYGKKIVQARTGQLSVTNESISGISQIKIYMNQNMWINKFKEKLDSYYYNKLRAAILSTLPHIVLETTVICAIGATGIILKLTYGSELREMIPPMIVYAYAILRITPSLAAFGALRINLANLLPNIENCYSTLKMNTRFLNDGDQILKPFSSEVSFKDVSFEYPNRKKVFEKISLKIKKGQTVAIVGPSGSGKSTLMDLLVRFYDPNEGTITVDGIDFKNSQIFSWRRQIGYVSQEPFIFHDTIEENIVCGKNNYQMSEIIEAAKIAQANDFIRKLPEGYKTIVGDRGMKLSGGQKQRIAIARAIIRKPRLIIFDEATSALDNISEGMVQEAINKISKEYTVIIVAHRLSTIQNVDKIIVLDNHKVAEEGNHAELLNLKGVYWRLYNQSLEVGE